jgi:uncharacterized protein
MNGSNDRRDPAPLFRRDRALIGMVHADALPGTPRSSRGVRAIAERASAEARILRDVGFDGIIVENMHDRPYVNAPHDPAITAAMVRIASEVRRVAPDLTLGVQILSRGERESLAVALAAEADFVRCENFVYAHVADEGLLADACAGPLLRYRRSIGAGHVRICCDIKKKHASHALTADLTLADAAHAAEFFGADALIVTGAFTGSPTDPGDIEAARRASSLPVMVGSGATPDQLPALFTNADAVIVGSWIKVEGVWSNPVDADRCRRLVDAADSAREARVSRPAPSITPAPDAAVDSRHAGGRG